MAILHSYVSLPEGIYDDLLKGPPQKIEPHPRCPSPGEDPIGNVERSSPSYAKPNGKLAESTNVCLVW